MTDQPEIVMAGKPASFVPGLGMRLPKDALTEFHKYGISGHANIAVLHQPQARRWVLSAQESGGAVESIGHYVGFASVESKPALWSQRIPTVTPNAIHRKVVASALIRFEMYRFQTAYDLLISLHWLEEQPGTPKPVHRRKNLFIGRFGGLDEALWTDAGKPLRGSVKPTFFSRAGEPIEIPAILHDGVYRATEAVCCLRCKHAHFDGAETLSIPVPESLPAAVESPKHVSRSKKETAGKLERDAAHDTVCA